MDKPMKILKLIFINVIFCSLAYGQIDYFSYKTYTLQPDIYQREYSEGKAFTVNHGKSGNIDFSLPIFSHSSNKYAANKINKMLQISELEILKGFERKSIFEKVSYDGGGIYGGKTDINFEIFSNTQNLLSVRINNSSCGATCAYWVNYYNFNSGNGDLVQLNDLFTKTGYLKFYELVAERRVADLNKELIKKITPDERQNYSNIADCYENDELEDFYIKNNILYIDGENCFHKGQKFDGIEIVSGIKLAEFEKYFNDYGKSLFSITNDSIEKYRSNGLPQLFEGTIAGQNVLLVLNINYYPSFNEVKAEYVYSKYGKGIYLEGKIDNNRLILTEKLAVTNDTGLIKYVDNGFIKADIKKNKIVGIWTNKDETKTYKLSLKRK